MSVEGMEYDTIVQNGPKKVSYFIFAFIVIYGRESAVNVQCSVMALTVSRRIDMRGG